ncbi:MAG TPA: glycerol kinase, partial [Dietzia sp.]|nr:glycerol kinase [Dietzia sp.]
GAACAAGLGVGEGDSPDRLRGLWREDRRWEPRMSDEERGRLWDRWNDAVERTLNWAVAEG